ncbi:saccharopine dehydrogenase NADP-binding domain-containing protein [Marinobacter daepoensis]|uniref:Saccharopine dehydrogenase NADP-binding domain-containing protein n=1 Tax=Marinobacter daepoensis TaxID=262077 RepID=A0ABS3BIN5_9GAMM|nr:saccharopine dehydrogenase NADP-binding domain-containing protein [Marinobacter daepoensis]MBN7771358.1 saccharopine dehydrogenase NADP-binding domain-containing protein [Marinobacter daepoensis]MBY6079959.1 saccharopine dehydrogenase NADP-binding domain-containing protein [Marinobacter daepoensis]
MSSVLMNRANEKETVVVLGGYGAVGAAVCEALALNCRVVVAGRDFAKAQHMARRLGEQAEAAQLDTTAPSTYRDLLKRASVVVNCVEHNNFAVAEQCLAHSVHYVDVSASADVISQLQTLDSSAKSANATVVFSVGVAPGLTNLLVDHAQSRLGPLKRADIFVLLGLGESHGAAAIQWTLKQFGHKFSVKTDGARKEVSAFCEGLSTTMPEPFGRRTGYRFDFSDQHTLPATLRIESVNTWLCFDSRAVTRILWCLAKSRLLSVLPLWRGSNTISKLSHWVPMGGTQFAVQVDAIGGNESPNRFTLTGDGEADVTGRVAAHVAGYLLSSSAPPGALHLEQLMNLETLLEMLGNRLFVTESVSEPGM